MKTKLSLLLSLFSILTLSAQIEFVPAYYITNEGERVDCLIKDMEWNMNPTSFEYKIAGDELVKTATIDNIKIFEVESAKYERFTVDVDMSRNEVAYLTVSKTPNYEEKTVFLKYIIEGEKSLLSYKGEGLNKFIIKDEDEVQQLVYKEYLTETNDVAKNELYKGQLIAILGFSKEMQQRISTTAYNEKSLLNLFEFYHKTNCEECVVYKEDKVHTVFFSLKGGVDMAKIRTTTPNYYNGLDLGLRVRPCFAVELEYILPVNKGRWSIFFEPTYVMGDSEEGLAYESRVSTTGPTFVDYSYNVVKVPLGVRYYNFLSDDIKLFADLSVSYPITWDSSIKYYTEHTEVSQQPIVFSKIPLGISMSVGCNYKNYAAQIRYNGFNQELAGNSPNYEVSYNSISFHFAYKFQLNKKDEKI